METGQEFGIRSGALWFDQIMPGPGTQKILKNNLFHRPFLYFSAAPVFEPGFCLMFAYAFERVLRVTPRNS